MIAFAVVAAQYVSTFDAMVSSREDVRANNPANVVTVGGKQQEIAVGTDFMLTGSALVRTHDRHWDFTLAYTPSLVVPDVELLVDSDVQPPVQPTLLNGASAGIRWHDRVSWFALSESGAYGYISTAIPYTGPPASAAAQTTGTTPPAGMTGMTPTMGTPPTTGMTPTGTAAPTQATLFKFAEVQYGASSSSLAVGTALGRHTVASLSGSYTLSGGLDSGTAAVPETTIVPYFEGPTGALTIATTLSPTESVFTAASGNYTYMNGSCPYDMLSPDYQRSVATQAQAACTGAMDQNKCEIQYLGATFSCQTKSSIAEVTEGYRRQLGLLSSVTGSVGLGTVYGPGLNAKQELGIVPVVALSYSQDLYTYWPGVLSLTFSLAPTADLLTSTVSDMATLVAMLNARVTKRMTLAFSLTGLQSVPIPSDNGSPLTSVAAGVEARLRLNREVDLLLGDQEYWQDQFFGGAPPLFSPSGTQLAPAVPAGSSQSFAALLYVGVTLRSPTLHF